MPESLLDAKTLEELYSRCSVAPPPVTRYETDENGVVYLYAANGSLVGITSKACLDYLLTDPTPQKPTPSLPDTPSSTR